MAQARTRNPRYVTAAGVTIFPAFVEPDTKFDPEGVYKTKLRLKPDAVIKDAKGNSMGTTQEFIDSMMEKALEKAKTENKGKIKEADAPYEIDEENGDVLVNFKLKATGQTRDGKPFTQKPALFDAKGNPCTPESVWGGSICKISFEVVPFYTKLIGAGVSFRMKAVQIIELRQGGAADAGNYGFGEEEGFVDEGKAQSADAGFASDDADGYEDMAQQAAATNGADF